MLGIQRIAIDLVEGVPLKTDPIRDIAMSDDPPPVAAKVLNGPKRKENGLTDIPKTNLEPVKAPIAVTASTPVVIPPRADATRKDSKDVPIISPPQQLEAPKAAELHAEQPSNGKERRHMSTKWLGMALGRPKQESPNEKLDGAYEETAPAEAPAEKMHPIAADKDLVESLGDLQGIEDIYRAAGIMNPRMGYSISKVVEMLNSNHIVGLPVEAKRAAVLMALDAAGVSLDQVLRDATLRQNALDAYESDQQKHFEEHWARKNEGNAQIQAELQRATAECLGRIDRNLGEVAQEKASFARWQTMKQQEAERITEAAGLCSKPSPAEPRNSPILSLRGIDPTVRPS